MRERLAALVPIIVGSALSLLVLTAFDVQDGAVAGITFVAITLTALATLRWNRRHHALVLRGPGERVRVIRRWGPYLTLPGVERLRDTIDMRAQTVHEPREPMVIGDNLVIAVDLFVRYRVVDVRLAATSIPRRTPNNEGYPWWMRLSPPFEPGNQLLDQARAYLRPAVQTSDLDTLRERTPQLVDGLRRALDARANQWGLVIEDATIRF